MWIKKYGNFVLRDATDSDKDEAYELLRKVFGGNLDCYCGTLDDYWGSYVIATHNGDVVAVTGLLPEENSDFLGWEVNWTCTSPGFRHNGLVTELLRHEIEHRLPKGASLFCEAWRIGDNKINLYGVLTSLGFRQVGTGMQHGCSEYESVCKSCPQRKGVLCECYTDVWKLN